MSPELEAVVTQLILEAWNYCLFDEEVVDYVCARCDATPSEVEKLSDALYNDMRD